MDKTTVHLEYGAITVCANCEFGTTDSRIFGLVVLHIVGHTRGGGGGGGIKRVGISCLKYFEEQETLAFRCSPFPKHFLRLKQSQLL